MIDSFHEREQVVGCSRCGQAFQRPKEFMMSIYISSQSYNPLVTGIRQATLPSGLISCMTKTWLHSHRVANVTLCHPACKLGGQILIVLYFRTGIGV